ncbi:hydantoinase/oxoprolinase family protein, partial [Mesorhizobium sp. B2-7-1]|uniref:hydantoinase/oxoprolinase N-terminal domain-containing protein n=1 Tax=Mesorhizobium sp. B2-7-1 TaxID=2589909 RepID=UPI0011280E4D
MAYQVCIDIGGTFTDCLVSNSKGEIAIFKSPTTPGEFEKGFINVLHVAAEGYGLSGADFMREIDLVVHGSTVSTNALVERKTVKVGLILTAGHQDILVLREGPRKGAFQWRLNYPDPYVPRHLTKTVAGRIDARGRELAPLSLDDVRKAAAEFRGLGVEAIAVGLLWSVVNPAHELAVREILEKELPGIPVTLSHEINPMPREYKRIIAAAIDASINPIVRTYIEKLKTALDEEGFEGELLLANCVGGMMPLADMIRKPIYSVMSGPTLAPMAALALSDEPDIIVGDMGGTTFDVSALRDHQIIVTPDSMIHDDSLGIPKVDVRSGGAGGGSIAFVDEGGLLQVGPRSAGARPGPACYGQGGTEPTVTDANVVLG